MGDVARSDVPSDGDAVTIYVGIDPGANGGFAFIPHGDPPSAFPLTLPSLVGFLRTFGADLEPVRRDIHVGVELVHAMPGQGVTSMFSFGQRYGEVLGVLAAFGITPTLVPPQVWQAVMFKEMGADGVQLTTKQKSIMVARACFPSVDLTPPGKRTFHDGMADALCIAEYMRLRGAAPRAGEADFAAGLRDL